MCVKEKGTSTWNLYPKDSPQVSSSSLNSQSFSPSHRKSSGIHLNLKRTYRTIFTEQDISDDVTAL